MPKQGLSTTVDADLLQRARALHPGSSDASMAERALRALLDQHRRALVDEAYARAYADHPLEAADEWGDLASFGHAAGSR